MKEENPLFVKLIPYRLNTTQAIFGSLILFPGSLFCAYSPFLNPPCSPDRRSGDCSLGSPFLEELFLFSMIGLGLAGLTICGLMIYGSLINRKHSRGRRIAFTTHSIIGPLHGFWRTTEGEIKFNEITELRIVSSKYGTFLRVTSNEKIMLFNAGRLMVNENDFAVTYNYLADKIGAESFTEIASAEVKNAVKPFKRQIQENPHLYSSGAFSLLGGLLILISEVLGNHEPASNDFGIGFLLSVSVMILILSQYYKEIWYSRTQEIAVIIFFMGTGFFLTFLGIAKLLAAI